MNHIDLLNVTYAMKQEILSMILNNDFSNETKTKRTLRNIDNMYDRLGLEADDIIPDSLASSYGKGTSEATDKLKALGLTLGGSALKQMQNERTNLQSQVHIEALTQITYDTMLDFSSAIRTAKTNTDKSIGETLSKIQSDLTGGIIRGDARKEVTKRVAQSFDEKGMTAFITSDNKRLPLDFYSETVVRTNLKRANTEGAVNRYKDNDIDLVKIGGASPTCHHCFSYRDHVLSLSGEDTRFPSAKNSLPPYHPNCQCSVSPFVETYKTEREMNKVLEKAKSFDPDVDNRSKSMKEGYKKDQDRKRRRNDEKKQFASYKAVLGDDAPKTLGAFRRSKSSNSQAFTDLQRRYREANKELKPVKSLNKLPELSNDLSERLTGYESIIKDWSYEQANIFNDEGRSVYTKEGTRNSVDIDEAIQKGLMKGNTLTHNHPSGQSLSPQDIHVMLYHDLKEIRAIGSNGSLYRASPPTDKIGKAEAVDYLDKNFESVQEKVKKELIKELDSGLITNDEANIEHFHRVWESITKETGISYERWLSNE